MSTDILPAVGPPAAGYRRALVGASVGNVVEWYDFALFAGSATVIAAVLTPGGWAGFTTVFAVFAMSCLFRPLGALVIGTRADRLGRRSVLAATIVLMAGATVAIGLLPPWAAIGVAAPLCLLALRAVQAFSCGGEIGVSVAYLMEFSPAGRRGRYGGWYLSTVGVGIAAGLGATAVVAALVDQDALESWGWRLPFLLALPLGLVGLYIRRRLAESPVFTGVAPSGRVAPLAVFREFGPTVRRCFVLACAYSAAFNVWFLFLPSYVTATGASSLAVALGCALAGLLVTAITAPVFGRVSDRVGRRPVLLGATASLAVVAVPLYLWMLTGSTIALLLGSVAMGVVIGAFVIPAFFSEQFPARVRATGLGLAYGVGSAVVGGTAPVLATVLSRQAPAFVVPGYLVALAVLALIAVRRSAETRPRA
jgi:MHS family proline/betaine transporter-like MFS transporter